jgi:hypothetical protein
MTDDEIIAEYLFDKLRDEEAALDELNEELSSIQRTYERKREPLVQRIEQLTMRVEALKRQFGEIDD